MDFKEFCERFSDKTDSYLLMTMCEDEQDGRTDIKYPFLFQTKEGFDPSNIPGLEMLGKIGNICCGLGTIQTVETLDKNEFVISIEASRPGVCEDETALSVVSSE